jgi:hydroxymethylglutaryl-CoA reductase
MRLHARSVAVLAGVPDLLFDEVVSKMVASGEIKAWKAKELANEAASKGVESIDSFADDAAIGSAAGKVILLGEHAVVYGRHALALPLADAVTVAVKESKNGMSLAVPGWNLFQSWQAEDNLSGAAAVVDLVVRELGVEDRDFEIHVKSDIPIGMGLGSSAAFAVAVIRAFSALLKINSTDEAINELAFQCEEIAHGTPSGIDNHVATFARPVLFHKGDRKHVEVIDLLETPPLVIASSGSRGVTKDIVAAVRKRYEKNQGLFTRVFDDIDSISLEGVSALKNRDYEQLGSLMNVCHGLLNAIQVSTPELEQMIEVARRAGAAGAKLTGAGGGGSIVALCPDKVSAVAAALRDAGCHVFEMDLPTGTL